MRTLAERATLQEAQEILSRERKAAKKARRPVDPVKKNRGRELDKGFLTYLRRQPCEARAMGGCDGPIEAAHIRYSDAAAGSINPGMGRKNHDRHANPLCHFHHQHDQHKRAERFFWDRLGKDAYETAAGHHARFKAQ